MKKIRQIAALTGAILLMGLYISTFVFALLDLPASDALLMMSIYCTVAVPILLFAMGLVAKLLRERGKEIRDE